MEDLQGYEVDWDKQQNNEWESHIDCHISRLVAKHVPLIRDRWRRLKAKQVLKHGIQVINDLKRSNLEQVGKEDSCIERLHYIDQHHMHDDLHAIDRREELIQ